MFKTLLLSGLILGFTNFFSLAEGWVAKITLETQMNPTVVPADELQTVEFSLIFRNRGLSPVVLYPKASRFEVESGWYSPVWRLTVGPYWIHSRLKELRSWYGPPGHPPGGSYFQRAAQTLEPGQVLKHDMSACWIPSTKLQPENLSERLLDPEGMDGLKRLNLSRGSSVLVFNITCKGMEKRIRERADFLRPGLVLFLPPGAKTYDLVFGYRQEEWSGFFRPHDRIVIRAQATALRVNHQ